MARHKRAIRKSFRPENPMFHQFAKVFSLKSFPLYGMSVERSGGWPTTTHLLPLIFNGTMKECTIYEAYTTGAMG